MTLKNRLAKLEAKRGASMPEVIVVYMDGGRVGRCDARPELTGKTETDIDAAFSARDVLLVKVVRASDNERETGKTKKNACSVSVRQTRQVFLPGANPSHLAKVIIYCPIPSTQKHRGL